MTFLITFLLSTFFVLVLTPLITRYANKNEWFDAVGGRKIHSGKIPRIGGIGIMVGCFLAFGLSIIIIKALVPGSVRVLPSFYVVMVAGMGYQLLGLADDFRNLRAKFKFIIQLALAAVVVASGYYFRSVEIPVAPYVLRLGLVGPVLTVFWIVGIANALNLIDGMDGMAGGIALIGSLVWATLYLKTGQYLPALVALSAAGAILGFVFYNFPPASIFMGDSGSLFLGYVLAVLPLLGDPYDGIKTGLVPAITICLIPILDTFAAILRRWRLGVSFFTPDMYHLHHKLLNLGFSARQVLAIIYSFCGLLGFSVLVGVYATPMLSFWLMMGSWAVWGAVFVLLHFLKERKVCLVWDEAKECAKE
jgi:UDP-GlcNAc:undecaprenyl-phosphate GlcNAc-1-phosphate transferase